MICAKEIGDGVVDNLLRAIFPSGLFLIHDRQAEFPARGRFALVLLFHAA
jgi:hypothetical protein